jgi:Iap family predicted aminopeptidase
MSKRSIALYLAAIGFLLVIAVGWYARAFLLGRNAFAPEFDGQRAYTDVETQVAFGPRTPGSDAHAQTRAWMQEQLEAAGWQVEVQHSESMGHPIYNLIARRSEQPPQIIVGAHYDSRIYADRDPDLLNQTLPVPGANDGASGVAVLIELARTLPDDTVPIWLVFFDAEDNGHILGWDWILGSRAFVAKLTTDPQAMILVDMVGDADLKLPMEGNSDPLLRAALWKTAAQLGYEHIFIPQVKYNIDDDHIPFLEAGIPAVDIIDIDYTAWHTLEDTPDKVSPRSLQVVGNVLWTWLAEQGSSSK